MLRLEHGWRIWMLLRLGSAVGPHPYPTICMNSKVISEESKRQILEKEGRLPDYVIACVGGGPMPLVPFSNICREEEVGLIGGRSSWTWLGYRSARSDHDQRDCRCC